MKKSVAIIGSGPAALMLAATLNETIFNVTVYERNFAPARKFLVAGDGGLNLTHSEELEQFITRYNPSNYLDKCLRSFSNLDLQAWLRDIGIETFIGSSKRVFPLKKFKPIDVLKAILNQLKNNNVQLITKHEWKGWNDKNELLFENSNDVVAVNADVVVFALGGASWSKTGSDGKWTNYFSMKNIEIVPFQSSNCAYQVNWDKNFIMQAEGKPLKNISALCDGKEKKGEIVITRFGIEGGAVYALSSEILRQMNEHKTATIFIDLKPLISLQTIKAKLTSHVNQNITKVLKEQIKLNDLQLLLVKSILSKEDFINVNMLSEKIKQLPLQITGLAPINESISTVGGIALFETDENFQLHKLPNHYAIGEMLDWNAPTGGYLLQACFSMGRYLGKKLNEEATTFDNF